MKVGDGKAEVPDTVPFPEFDEGPFPESPANPSLFGKDTPASPTKEIFAAEEPVASPIPQSKEHMTTKEEDNGGEGVTIGQEGDDFNTLLKNSPSPTFMVTTSTDTGGSTKEEEDEEKEKEEENREHLTHFKIWGTPTARSKPSGHPNLEPRFRTVKLTFSRISCSQCHPQWLATHGRLLASPVPHPWRLYRDHEAFACQQWEKHRCCICDLHLRRSM